MERRKNKGMTNFIVFHPPSGPVSPRSFTHQHHHHHQDKQQHQLSTIEPASASAQCKIPTLHSSSPADPIDEVFGDGLKSTLELLDQYGSSAAAHQVSHEQISHGQISHKSPHNIPFSLMQFLRSDNHCPGPGIPAFLVQIDPHKTLFYVSDHSVSHVAVRLQGSWRLDGLRVGDMLVLVNFQVVQQGRRRFQTTMLVETALSRIQRVDGASKHPFASIPLLLRWRQESLVEDVMYRALLRHDTSTTTAYLSMFISQMCGATCMFEPGGSSDCFGPHYHGVSSSSADDQSSMVLLTLYYSGEVKRILGRCVVLERVRWLDPSTVLVMNCSNLPLPPASASRLRIIEDPISLISNLSLPLPCISSTLVSSLHRLDCSGFVRVDGCCFTQLALDRTAYPKPVIVVCTVCDEPASEDIYGAATCPKCPASKQDFRWSFAPRLATTTKKMGLEARIKSHAMEAILKPWSPDPDYQEEEWEAMDLLIEAIIEEMVSFDLIVFQDCRESISGRLASTILDILIHD